MQRWLVGGCLFVVALACGGGDLIDPSACSSAALQGAIAASDAKLGSMTHFACADGHAFARGTYDCEGCVAESVFFLTHEGGQWTVLGSSQSMDPSLCEESRRMSFDACGALYADAEIGD